MEGNAVLPIRLLILADITAIAIGVALLYRFLDFGGSSLIGYVCIAIFVPVASMGLWMWANGSGAKLVSMPGWNDLDDELQAYGSSVMGLHIAVSMALMSAALPTIMVPRYGLVLFFVLLFLGIGMLIAGAIRVLVLSPSGRRFVPKQHLTVWMMTFLCLFAIVAAPVLILENVGEQTVDVTLGDTSVRIRAPMVDSTIDYSEIENVYLDEDFTRGDRTSGFHGFDISSGKYNNSDLGRYTLASFDSCRACVVIVTDSGDEYAFNQKTYADTESLYLALKEKV